MKFIWFFFILQILGYSLIKPFINQHDLALLLLVSSNAILVLFFIGKFNSTLRNLFFIGFVSRFSVMLIDIYMRGIIIIPHSGEDTERFYQNAINISGHGSKILDSNYEIFIKLAAFIFTITESERIIIQYSNVLLGFTTVYIVYIILKMIEIRWENKIIGILILLIFPHAIFFSGIFLREMVSAFFVVCSIFYIVYWFHTQSKNAFLLSILMVLASALFHSGTIGLLAMHAFIMIFYKNSKLVFQLRSVLLFVIMSIFLVWFFGVYDWSSLPIFRKLQIKDIQDVYDEISTVRGSSAYLTELSINNIFQMILYGPIYIFYFISSPLPIDWRGFNDIISFMLDGILYLSASVYIFINFKKIPKKNQTLIIILLVGLLTTVFIFSIGVQNAGTALRHRHKVFYLLIIIFIMIKDFKLREKINVIRKNGN
ncbi:hypothetical protein B4U37_20090 [Sutcliffiella horikoshii]|uniref:Glycosyltransferase RgtA/B/C/D-like domain-containing protein n=1 Tax=Sutcliffiella horikoshii TaxID=79883 RepID=A0ABN4ZIF6_9BACI|nr:hypothetical protein [Sutcliffiella horikoshii]ART78202.1 hypothetical protein B4U37_20090 [Sutcliffiella horikoshii]